MISAPLQPTFSPLLAIAVFAGLLAFGTLYNAIIAWAEKHKYLEGYTAYAVVLGTLVTLGGVAIISWEAALICLIAFVASGLPMILGSTWRYIEARKREREYERQTARMAQQRESGEG